MNNFATCYLEKFEVIALSNIKDKAVMDGWMDGRMDHRIQCISIEKPYFLIQLITVDI